MTKYKTAESVRRGHPDKLCDLITDSILDECLRHDRYSRCACEVMATKGKIFVCGEITCAAKINIRSVVREVLRKVGYNPMKFIVFVYVHRQSADIAGGVDSALEVRNSGQRGCVRFHRRRRPGHRVRLRHQGDLDPSARPGGLCRMKSAKGWMMPCTMEPSVASAPMAKAQVTVAYEDGKPVGAKNIVVSVQHDADKDLEELRREIISEVLYPILDRFDFPKDVEILINPSGRFVEGGPAADTGLTGRKLMVDTYGGLAAHGAEPSPGRTPPRWTAPQLTWPEPSPGTWWARGWRRNARYPSPMPSARAEPTAVEIDTFGTARVDEDVIRLAVLGRVRPAPRRYHIPAASPRSHLRDTAAYGHFNGYKFSWENLDKTEELRKAVEKYAD